jgi:hypothetical protein
MLVTQCHRDCHPLPTACSCATTTVAAAVCCCCSGPADATLGDAMTAIDADEIDMILSEDEQDSDIIGLTLSAAATAQVCCY